ncbi:MAG: hypothetical protein H5T63_11535 [Chloroflexi bacterium]|nr:hypothetical protein [Chloroflexota bacterium]
MRKRLGAVIALGLLLSLLVSSVSAQGVDPGTGKTNIFMQNLGTENAQVSVKFYREDSGAIDWDTTLDPIPPLGSRYLLFTQFGVADNWAGAGELASTQPLAAIVNMFWDGSNTAATYTGVDAPATEVYLPGLSKITGVQTRVSVQNTESVQTTVNLNFYNRNGTLVGTKVDTIPAKAEKTYYLDQVPECNFSATGGNGALYITSSPAKISAMASIHTARWSAAYSGVSSGDTTIWVPGVFRKLSGTTPSLYSAVTIQNLGNTTANVTINLLGIPGQANYSFNAQIPAKASYGVNTVSVGQMDPTIWNAMVAAIGNNWQGSIKVTSDQPLTASGFYFMPSATQDILGYNGFRDVDATTKLSMPAVYRKLTGAAQQISTTLVQNLSNTPGTLNVKFFGSDGLPKGNVAGYNVPLPANSSVRLHLQAGLELPAQALTDLGTEFSGAMLITSTGGQRIIGITNILYTSLGRASGYPGFPIP